MEKDVKLTQAEIAQIKHNAIQERIKKFNTTDVVLSLTSKLNDEDED